METELFKAIEGIGTSFEKFKESNDDRWQKMNDRLEKMEAEGDKPRMDGGKGFDRDAIEHKSKFESWVRDPHDHARQKVLAEAESEISKKAVTIGSSAGGGYAVPAIIASEIEKRVNVQNPWRSLVRVVTVGSNNYTHLVSTNAAGYGWVGEGGSRSETDTSSLIPVAPTYGTIYAYPKASEESMQDIFFDVGAWLVEEVSDGFAAGEATAIWSGNGSDKPSGLRNTTPSSSGDTASPQRAHTALQYVPLGAYSSPASLKIDSLLDLLYSVNEQYLAGGNPAWVMRRSTAAIIRKLKDNDGRYHWQPATVAGQPDTLLGYPVYQSDCMDSATAGSFPVAFGNFKRGYLFTVRQDIRITVDDNITTPGQVKFYVRRRVGGKVLNNHSVKLLKYSPS